MPNLRQILDIHKSLEVKVKPLRTQINGLIRRITIGRSSQSSGNTNQVNGTTFGESSTGGENLQQYGLASNPPSGSEGVYLKGIGAIICVDSRSHRPDAASGEVVLYSKHGQTIRLKEDGSIVMIPKAGSKVEIGGDPADTNIARADLVNAELAKIATTLTTGSNSGGPVVFGTPYTAGTTDATIGRVT